MAAHGASRPLQRIPAIVSFLNHSRHSAYMAGTPLHAPIPVMAPAACGREKQVRTGPARRSVQWASGLFERAGWVIGDPEASPRLIDRQIAT
jgi:hypothetical protein